MLKMEPSSSSADAQAFTSLWEAIGIYQPSVCEVIIQRHPQVVHYRGWHGQSALHRACLRGDLVLVKILLSYGASPNMINDTGVTPVHFASLQGNPSVIEILVQHGGDVTILDKYGRSCLHYAAQGGNVCALHYLSVVHGLAFDSTDCNLQTSLHVVCMHGNMEALKYLLKNKRCSVVIPDKDGNTALHYAVRAGLAEMCWLLIMADGRETIFFRNKQNQSPLDWSTEGKTYRHQGLAEWLSQWSVNPQSFSYPKYLWYCHLILPSAWLGVTYLICTWILQGNQGIVAVPSLLALTYIMIHSHHRLKHPCRWPNPIFASFLFTSIVITVVYYFFNLLPNLYGYIFWNIFGCSNILLMIYTYGWLLYSHPETIIKQNGPAAILELAQTNVFLSKFCGLCEIILPEKTRHCKLCNCCVTCMDHHCLFLFKCVGEYNQKVFVLFLSLMAMSQLTYLISCYLYIQRLYGDKYWWDTFKMFFNEDVSFLALAVLNITGTVLEIYLLKHQFTSPLNETWLHGIPCYGCFRYFTSKLRQIKNKIWKMERKEYMSCNSL